MTAWPLAESRKQTNWAAKLKPLTCQIRVFLEILRAINLLHLRIWSSTKRSSIHCCTQQTCCNCFHCFHCLRRNLSPTPVYINALEDSWREEVIGKNDTRNVSRWLSWITLWQRRVQGNETGLQRSSLEKGKPLLPFPHLLPSLQPCSVVTLYVRFEPVH